MRSCSAPANRVVASRSRALSGSSRCTRWRSTSRVSIALSINANPPFVQYTGQDYVLYGAVPPGRLSPQLVIQQWLRPVSSSKARGKHMGCNRKSSRSPVIFLEPLPKIHDRLELTACCSYTRYRADSVLVVRMRRSGTVLKKAPRAGKVGKGRTGMRRLE
jgi:hypothetical protein